MAWCDRPLFVENWLLKGLLVETESTSMVTIIVKVGDMLRGGWSKYIGALINKKGSHALCIKIYLCLYQNLLTAWEEHIIQSYGSPFSD